MNPLAEKARRAFAARFGAEPAFVARAPGRVNLIGEHTDYNLGFVLPMAIERECIAAARPSPSGVWTIVAHNLGEEGLIDPGRARATPRGSWQSYAAGVLALLAERAASPGGLDLLITSTVPLGSGLSSSASLEVSVALAAAAAWKLDLPALEFARLCRRAEHDFAGVPCGIMDQFISAMGVAGRALLIDCRDQTSTHIALPQRTAILVMNTGVRHELAAGDFAARKAACEAACAALGVGSLREVDLGRALAARVTLSDEQQRCVRHVVTENRRTLDAAAALQAGRLDEVGRLMTESHRSLRDDYRVSCAELDAMVELAAAQPGVHGARMTGGGFGGCAIALVWPDAALRVRAAVQAGYTRRFGRVPDLFTTAAAPGAGLLG